MSNRQVWSKTFFYGKNDNPTCYCSSLKSWIRFYFLPLGLGLILLDKLAMKLTFKAGFVPWLVVIQLFQWLMVNVYWKCISLSKIYHSKSLNIHFFIVLLEEENNNYWLKPICFLSSAPWLSLSILSKFLVHDESMPGYTVLNNEWR